MKQLGYAFDWDREIVTADPEYYRWNQWFFLKMLEKGLVYRRQGKANWCTGCMTVIANEQVREDEQPDLRALQLAGAGEGHPRVGLPHHPYAQSLLDGLDELTDWPERITTMQRNWIGKSDGRRGPTSRVAGLAPRRIQVFTTRVDTIYGCTYVVLAPEHPLVGDG